MLHHAPLRLFQEYRHAFETLEKSIRGDDIPEELASVVDTLIIKNPSLNAQQLVKTEYFFFLQRKDGLTNVDIAALIYAHCSHVINIIANQPPEIARSYFNYLNALCDYFKNHREDEKIRQAIDSAKKTVEGKLRPFTLHTTMRPKR